MMENPSTGSVLIVHVANTIDCVRFRTDVIQFSGSVRFGLDLSLGEGHSGPFSFFNALLGH